MTFSRTAMRSVRRGAILAPLAAIGASLAMTAGAGAAIITPLPDGAAGTDHLATAITTANGNSDSSNTIVLSDGTYTPEVAFNGTQGLPPITKNLTITTDHADQALNGSSSVLLDGSHQSPSTTDTLTVNAGVTVTLEGFTITAASGPTNAVIRDKGNLVMYGMDFEGDNGTPLIVSSGATATINESLIDATSSTSGLTNAGSTTLNNSDVTNNATGGVGNNSGATLVLNNTLVANNNVNGAGTHDCAGALTAQDHSMDDDGSCKVGTTPVTYSNEQYWTLNGNFPSAFTNGGPTASLMMDSPSAPTYQAADPAKCPLVDQRFFPIPAGQTCDVGAEDFNATQETTGPTCNTFTITQNGSGQNVSQAVNVTDPSGLGPEFGSVMNDVAPVLVIGVPPMSVPVSPADMATNVSIDNGTVATSQSATAAPSNSGVTVTATKTTVGVTTHWNFTAWNWAGVPTLCK